MRKGFDNIQDGNFDLFDDRESSSGAETKFLMVGDVLTVQRAGREFTPVELGLLRKVEMERASLLPSLVKDIRVHT